MLHVYSPIKRHAQTWDLSLVLRCLTRHPFELAAVCDLRLLSWKTLFLVAITCTCHTSELVALDIRPPFLSFLPHAVRLSTNLVFLSKVVSEFHLHSVMTLPDFYPDPKTSTEKLHHTLDVTRALKFYMHRTQFPDRDHNLFVPYANTPLGCKISFQYLSKWLVDLKMYYSLSKVAFTCFSCSSLQQGNDNFHGVPLWGSS